MVKGVWPTPVAHTFTARRSSCCPEPVFHSTGFPPTNNLEFPGSTASRPMPGLIVCMSNTTELPAISFAPLSAMTSLPAFSILPFVTSVPDRNSRSARSPRTRSLRMDQVPPPVKRRSPPKGMPCRSSWATSLSAVNSTVAVLAQVTLPRRTRSPPTRIRSFPPCRTTPPRVPSTKRLRTSASLSIRTVVSPFVGAMITASLPRGTFSPPWPLAVRDQCARSFHWPLPPTQCRSCCAQAAPEKRIPHSSAARAGVKDRQGLLIRRWGIVRSLCLGPGPHRDRSRG